METITSPERAIASTRLLSKRSAMDPVIGARRATGKNSATPIKPKSSAFPVMSHTCLPIIVI